MAIQDLRSKTKKFESLYVRPSRKNTRLFIDNEYFEKGYAKMFPKSVLSVYCVLAKYANYETQTCFPSIDTIMKESGIKRRNTVVNGLKTLEQYGIIGIEHSKGGAPNQYALLDVGFWKEPNSINTDTVNRISSDTDNSIRIDAEQYQKCTLNSITGDTGNHLIKLYKEIMNKNKNFSNKESQVQLSQMAFSVLKCHWRENDIKEAILELNDSGKEISFKLVKDLLKHWSQTNKIKPIREMNW